MTAFIRFILLCLMAGIAHAQSSLPACQSGFAFHNCWGSINYPNGDKYLGEFKDGLHDGQGTYTFPDGESYAGQWKQGKNNGLATYNFANGNKYVGEYKDNKRHGQGTYIFANGNKHEGEFKDGKSNGRGTYTFANGNKYVGDFKDDKMNGQGTYLYANGDKYIGNFKDGTFNGQGTFMHVNGDLYFGEWKDGVHSGQGQLTLSNGKKYVAEFKYDKPNGQGILIFPSGDKYVGIFKDGMPNGQGIEYTSSGVINRQGIWELGKLQEPLVLDKKRFPFNSPEFTAPVQAAAHYAFTSAIPLKLPACLPNFAISLWHKCFGTEESADGTKYVGEFANGKSDGRGTVTTLDGLKYEGQFKDGLFDGHGILTYPNGIKYFGEFSKGLINGHGTSTYPNGNKHAGSYKDNSPNGHGTLTFTNGSKYSGAFENGKRTGQGIYFFANGDIHVGSYKDGEQSGIGNLTFANGKQYAGEFKGDQLNGQGIEYSATGLIIRQGRWENNQLVQSFAPDPQRFPFVKSRLSSAALPEKVAAPDTGKEGGNLLAAEIEESRKKQQELEQRLMLTQNKPTAPPFVPERRVALVVGNAGYKNSPLANPVNDAVDMSATLTDLGFLVTTVQDASLRKLREATRIFESSVASADVALIFYAGHAVEAKGRNFVIPVDADVAREYELEDQAYDAQQWLAMLGDTKGKNTQRVNIVILDACRDNPVSRQWRSVSSGLGRMDAPSGTLLVYSTSPGKVASDGPKGQRNSPFTKSLLRSMQTPNVPVEQVLKDVRRQVLAETKGEQVPWENSSLIGDFVFKRQ